MPEARAKTDRVKHATLIEALVAFQEEEITLRKSKTARVPTKSGGEYTYTYADLGDILPIIRPLLARHGLAWTAKVGLDADGDYMLRYRLVHESGEEDADEIPLADGNASPQALGSAITYMRRYAQTAQLNLATEEDADAGPAQESPRRKAQRRQPAAPAAPATQAAPKVGAQRWEQIKAKITEANMPEAGQWLRTWLVGQGVENVPAEIKGSMLMGLSPAQGDELLAELQAEIDVPRDAVPEPSDSHPHAPDVPDVPPEDHGGALDVPPDEPPAHDDPPSDEERAQIEEARRMMAGEGS